MADAPEIPPRLRAQGVWWGTAAALVAILLTFHAFGNSTRGYVSSSSLWVWWSAQWSSPDAEMQHGPLIWLGSLILWVRAWRRERPCSVSRKEIQGGGTAWVLGWGLHVLGYAVQLPRLSVFGLLVLLYGLAGGVAGSRGRRASGPALVFLLFSLSWGFVDTLGLGVSLRQAVASVSAVGLSWLGFEVARQGTQLLPATGGTPFEVAAACAGLRSLSALVALAYFLGQLYLGRWRDRLLLLGAAVLLVWLGNLVRVMGTVGWSLSQGAAVSDQGHTVWGLVLFGVEVWALWEIIRFLPAPGPVVHDPLAEGAEVSRWSGAWLLVSAPLLASAGLYFLQAKAVSFPLRVIPVLPDWVGPSWSSQVAPLNATEISILPADTRWVRRVYVPLGRPSGAVLATQVQAGGDRTSLHRPELCLSGLGWRVVAREVAAAVAGRGPEATWLTLEQSGGRRGLMVYWFASAERTEATYGGFLAAWIADTFTIQDRAPWSYWALQTWVAPGEEDSARARLEEMAAQVWIPAESALSSRSRDEKD